MEPDNIVNENSKQNITLLCNVIRGNPLNLIEVEWYLDQEFLIKSPNCNNSEKFSGALLLIFQNEFWKN